MWQKNKKWVKKGICQYKNSPTGMEWDCDKKEHFWTRNDGKADKQGRKALFEGTFHGMMNRGAANAVPRLCAAVKRW